MNDPEWLRRLNKLEICCGNPDYLLNVTSDKLIQVAKETTNLNDFGDTSWVPYYESCLESIKLTAQTSPLLCVILKARLIIRLRNRLLTVEKIARQPRIKEENIDSPIIITGLPRSGTTILFELLNQDPRLRGPFGYETIQNPASDDKASNQRHRQDIAECLFDLNMDIAPKLKEIHDYRNDLPVECAHIMTNILTFPHPNIDGPGTYQTRISQYLDDNRYGWHKTVLQTLQHQSVKKTWLLKDPFHLHFLELVFETYPNARVIHTHRNPISAIPSLLSLVETMAKIFPEYKIKDVQQFISFFEGGLKKSIEQRSNNKSLNNRITDIYFSDLMENPTATLESCYKKLNIEYTDQTKCQITEYLNDRPREKYGKHHYQLTDFGLTEKALREKFKFYTDYYQIS